MTQVYTDSTQRIRVCAAAGCTLSSSEADLSPLCDTGLKSDYKSNVEPLCFCRDHVDRLSALYIYYKTIETEMHLVPVIRYPSASYRYARDVEFSGKAEAKAKVCDTLLGLKEAFTARSEFQSLLRSGTDNKSHMHWNGMMKDAIEEYQSLVDDMESCGWQQHNDWVDKTPKKPKKYERQLYDKSEYNGSTEKLK